MSATRAPAGSRIELASFLVGTAVVAMAAGLAVRFGWRQAALFATGLLLGHALYLPLSGSRVRSG